MSDFTYIIWAIIICSGVYQFVKRQKEDKEADEYYDQRRKSDLKKLLENRKTRENYQLFDKEKFWGLIEDLDQRSSGSYKNQLGLFKDYLIKLTPDQLIELDNLFNQLIRDGINWDVVGASFIILKSSNIETVAILVSWLISKGEVFYNNSILDVNFILKKEIIELTELIHSDIIAEVYYDKTNELLPLTTEEEIKIDGAKWKESELPSRFSNLWNAYA